MICFYYFNCEASSEFNHWLPVNGPFRMYSIPFGILMDMNMRQLRMWGYPCLSPGTSSSRLVGFLCAVMVVFQQPDKTISNPYIQFLVRLVCDWSSLKARETLARQFGRRQVLTLTVLWPTLHEYAVGTARILHLVVVLLGKKVDFYDIFPK